MLVRKAFEVEPYQIRVLAALESANYQLNAKVPAGTTKEQFKLMLQRVLREQLRLSFHRETQRGAAYLLKVSKGGAKLSKANETPDTSQSSGGDELPGGKAPEITLDKDGFPTLPPGEGFMLISMNGNYRLRAPHHTIEAFASRLAAQLQTPVVDQTGLKGYCDIELSWSKDASQAAGFSAGQIRAEAMAEPAQDNGRTLFMALRSELGLELEAGKAAVPVFVIDHAEKRPLEQ